MVATSSQNQTLSVTRGNDGTKIAFGRTEPGATNWKKNSLYVVVVVDTSAAGFTTVPIYTVSLGGNGSHSILTGTSSIHKPTAKNFEIWVTFEEGSKHNNDTELSPALANENKWHVNWIAIEPLGQKESSVPNTSLPIPGKDYYIIAKLSGKVVDVENNSTVNGGNISQYTKQGSPNQIWKLEDAGNGYYYLISKHSGKAVAADYSGVTGTNLNNVVQYDKFDDAEQQKWKLENAGDSYFHLVNKATGKLLDLLDGGQANGTNIQQCERNGNDAQKWKFEAV